MDARFSIRGARKAPRGIVLVQIDNATLQQLRSAGLHSEFPFPRRYDATVIDRLRKAGARAIALDLEFTHETDVRDDNALIEAIGRAHGKTVLAAAEVARNYLLARQYQAALNRSSDAPTFPTMAADAHPVPSRHPRPSSCHRV